VAHNWLFPYPILPTKRLLRCSLRSCPFSSTRQNPEPSLTNQTLQGVGGIPIHTVKKHQSKATVVLDPQWLPSGAVGLFVDDSLQEHADKLLQNAPNVHRVIFSRAKANQN
jgi:hypothetical protein